MPSKSLEEIEELVGDTHRVVEGLEVEAGKVAEFARAVGDDNPIYYDAEAATSQGFEAIPAPLTFTRTAYFQRYRPDGVTDLRPFDLGFQREHRIHGEQEYEYERPVYVGDVLTADIALTSVYQREGSRGGLMTFAVFELVYRDGTGAPVVTVRPTVIETAGAIDDGADREEKAGDDPTTDSPTGSDPGPLATRKTGSARERSLAADSVSVGDASPEVRLPPLERKDFARYAGASGDFNPVHYDVPYARDAGNDDVFAQGMLSAGFGAGLIADWYGLANVRRYSTRFRSRVFPGDSLVARGTVESVGRGKDGTTIDVELVVENQRGEDVLSGTATGKLPS